MCLQRSVTHYSSLVVLDSYPNFRGKAADSLISEGRALEYGYFVMEELGHLSFILSVT